MASSVKNVAKGGVDIVVMNCDNDGYIQKCVQTIIENTEGKFKLIVIDQNSKDGSREWLVNSKKISHLILNDTNVGAWEGRNQGFRAGKWENDWVVFFDSDVEVNDPNWIDKMWNYTIDPQAGVIESRVKIHDGSYMFGGFASCMIRKQVIKDIGLFDHHYLIGGDIDFWTRFKWNGKWRIYWCDDTDIVHHCGRTINRDRKPAEEIPEHVQFRQKLTQYKYTPQFLNDTVGVIDRLRIEEMKKRGWVV